MSSLAKKKVLFTYRDLTLFEPDNYRHEIIEGEHYMSPSPSIYHQHILLELAAYLRNYINEKEMGALYISPIDVVFHDIDVCVPDLAFVSKENMHIVREKYIQGAPDLLVEILSPSSVTRDKDVKYKRYAYYGVKEYWIVDPERTLVEVHDLTTMQLIDIFPKHKTLTTPMFPDLKLSLELIFNV